MARLARAELVDPSEVAVFHCINRCVRRAYLCGTDPLTGQEYSHRKAWLEPEGHQTSRVQGNRPQVDRGEFGQHLWGKIDGGRTECPRTDQNVGRARAMGAGSTACAGGESPLVDSGTP